MRKNVILSEKEKDIAYMMSRGFTVQCIADEMGISKEKLEYIIVTMKNKLHCTKNSEIARSVIRKEIAIDGDR